MRDAELLGDLLLHRDERLARGLLGRPPAAGDDGVAAGRLRGPREHVLAREVPRRPRAACARPRGSGAPLIAARRERTTGDQLGRARRPAPPRAGAKAAAWSGWTSMKKKAGALLGAPRSRAASRRLCSSSATATISITARPSETSTGAGVAARAVEIGRALPPGERAPAAAAGERDDEPRAERRAATSAPARPPTKSAPIFHEPACQSASAASPAAMGTAAEPRSPARQPRLDVVPQDERGRHAPDLEQRPEREEQRHAHAHREAAQDWRAARRPASSGIGRSRREERRERAAAPRCRGAAPSALPPRPSSSGLQQVDGEHLPPARAEALEDGDGRRACRARRRARSRRRRCRPPSAPRAR